jgi:Ca2+-binding RTX toxin-like protein
MMSWSDAGNDVLDGGQGLDAFVGGDGDDTYILSGGDGALVNNLVEVIQDTGGNDTIRFGPGINASSVTARQNGSGQAGLFMVLSQSFGVNKQKRFSASRLFGQ